MKIYFAGSIRAGRDNKEIYSKIIDLLKEYGEVLTEHVGHQDLTDHGEDLSDDFIYERDMDWLRQSDVLVADVSVPSIGVGYEIASAGSLNKKVLCLYKKGSPKRISGMINGNKNLKVGTYESIEDLAQIIEDFLK